MKALANRKRKSGIALVVVLGLLSILLLMAVAFAVTMRTSRLAARNYLDVVRTRNLMDVALARAIEHIDRNLAPSDTDYEVYPKWSSKVLLSSGAGEKAARNLFWSGEPLDHLPRYAAVHPVTQTEREDRRPDWVEVHDGAVPKSRLQGRYAYIVQDCSGFLDANALSNLTRQVGRTPGEIQVLSFMADVQNRDALVNDRLNTWKRFESVDELQYAQGLKAKVFPQNLFTFSHYPNGWLSDWKATNRVYIGGDDPGKWNQAAVAQGFTDAGRGDAPATLYHLLKDYVDADNLPSAGLMAPSTEAVPMINEIETGLDTENKVRARIELWYPFVQPLAGSYNLTYSLRFDALPAKNGTLAVGPLAPGEFQVIEIPTDLVVTAEPPKQVTATLLVVETAGNVDGVALKDLDFGRPYEVLDPRFNHSPTAWQPATPDSLGRENSITQPDYTSPDKDGDWHMFCANRALETVGELGYLPYEPWKTVKLYGPEADGVVNVFTIHTNRFARGLVNPNSPCRPVVSTVFKDMPIDEYPGGPTALTVNDSTAVNLGGFIYNSTTNFLNRGDWARRLPKDRDHQTWKDLKADTELLREAAVRNACELFDTRQNLFAAILVAQAVQDGDDNDKVDEGEVVGEQRAVAVVWRDPYRTGSGHDTFVRFFMPLME